MLLGLVRNFALQPVPTTTEINKQPSLLTGLDPCPSQLTDRPPSLPWCANIILRQAKPLALLIATC